MIRVARIQDGRSCRTSIKLKPDGSATLQVGPEERHQVSIARTYLPDHLPSPSGLIKKGLIEVYDSMRSIKTIDPDGRTTNDRPKSPKDGLGCRARWAVVWYQSHWWRYQRCCRRRARGIGGLWLCKGCE